MIKNRILLSLWSLLIVLYFLLYSNKIAVMLITFTCLALLLALLVKKGIIEKYISFVNINKKPKEKVKSENKQELKTNKNSVLRKFKSPESLTKLFLSLLMMSSMVLLFVSVMGIECSLLPVLFVGVCFTFLIWLEWGRKTSVYAVVLFVFGFILIGFVMKNQYALNSVLIFYNKVAEKLAMTGLRFPAQYVVEVAESSYPLYMTYLMSLFSSFAGLIAYVVVAHKQYFFLCFYAAIVTIAGFLGFEPKAVYVIICLFITAGVFIFNKTGLISLSYLYKCLAVFVISLCSLLIGETVGEMLEVYESPYDALSDRLAYKENTVDSYGEGKISGNSFYKSKETALRITMVEPKPMYLRGFTGAEFNGNRWLELESFIAYDNRELFNIFNNNGFLTYSQAASLNLYIEPDASDSQVSVEYVGAGNEYVYLPYELKSMISENYIKVLGDNIKSNSDELTYSFSTPGMLYQKLLTLSADNKDMLVGVSFADFDVCEENYNKFAYENYLNVRAEDREVIEDVLKRNNININDETETDNSKVIEYVKLVLNNELSYDEESKLSVFERNSVDALINDVKKGYDIHYASLATLLFRTLGIPARYVEGYVVSPTDSVKMKSNESHNIQGTSAHAWTEIYVEDVGWTPIEVYEDDYNKMFPTVENIVETKK